MEIDADADPEIMERLRTYFELEPWQVFPVNGPVNLSRLFNIYEQTQHPELKFKPYVPRELRLTANHKTCLRNCGGMTCCCIIHLTPTMRWFPSSRLRRKIQTCFPSNKLFTAPTNIRLSCLRLIEAAAKKEVTAVVELKARFDEASNIRWARDLEDAGVQVFHGLVGLKTHCKLSLLTRHDRDGVTRQYAHLGTGNYNANTARIYTDLSLLTADPAITNAAHNVFSFLTAYAEHATYDPLFVAPVNMAEHILSLIAREAEHAGHGRPAHIIAKMNALLDKNVVMALYRASQAGVKIDLIVRGICSLRPGYAGLVTISACAVLLGASWSTAAFIILRMPEKKKCIWAARTGCRATCTSESKLFSPS